MASLKKIKNWFQDQLSLNAGQKYCRMQHSATLLTFIKLSFIKIFVLSIFEWPLYTGFTVCLKILHVDPINAVLYPINAVLYPINAVLYPINAVLPASL